MDMSVAEEKLTEQETAAPGLLRRYFSVFFSPDQLFQGLRSQPAWGGAMLLGACLAAAGTFLLPPELMLGAIREQLLAQGQPVPPAFSNQPGWIRYAFAVAPLISWGILMTIFSGLVMVFFAFLLGHEGTFKQYLSVVVHAHLISATATIVLLPLRIVAEDAQLLLSLGSFAGFLNDGYVLNFLSYLDLFGLWSWLLVGLGVARIARKQSWWFGAVAVMGIPVTMAAVIAIFA